MKSRKRQRTEGIELPSQDKIRTLREKETYKYSGILEVDTIKHAEMKEKIKKKEYLRRTRKLFETKLHSRSLIKDINIWAVSFVRYSGLFWKWTREELQQTGQRTKLKSMHKGLHPRDDVNIDTITRRLHNKNADEY